MVTNNLHSQALPDDFASRIGRLIDTKGDMVEALFNPASLPDLMTELAVSDEARKRSATIRVMQRSGAASSAVANAPIEGCRGARY